MRPEKQQKLICLWCGQENGADSTRCASCERDLVASVVCSSCGGANPSNYIYCDVCGTPLAATTRGGWTSLLSLNMVSAASLALAAIVVLALVLRLVALETVPPNVTADEADNLQVVYHIVSDTGPGFFGLDWKPGPAFSTYVMSAFMRAFGYSIVGMRMASVVLSTVSIVVFYFVARGSLSRQASLASAFLLSTSLWYLHFSRSGWENIHVGLYALMTVFTLRAALTRRHWYLYAATGFFIALGLYGYMGGRMILVGVALYLPVALVLYPSDRKRVLGGYGLIALVVLVLFAPQLNTALNDWDRYNARVEAVSIFTADGEYRGDSGNPSIIVHQVWRTVDAFLLMDSGLLFSGYNGRYMPPGWALLDRATGVIFWIGLLASLLRWRQTALWWVMLLALIVPTQVFSMGTPDIARAVGAAPFYFLFVGQGIAWLLSWPVSRRWEAKTATLILLVAVAYVNVSGYFNWMDEPFAADRRGPAVEVEEFEVWQSLQLGEARAGRWGFNVNQWHEMRESVLAP